MALELEYLNKTSRLAVGAAGEMPDGGEGGAGAAAAVWNFGISEYQI